MPTQGTKRRNYSNYLLRAMAKYEEKLKKYGATRDAMDKAEATGREMLQDFLRANDYHMNNIGKPYTWLYKDLAKHGIFISDNFIYRIRIGELYTCSIYQLILISGYWGMTLPEMVDIGQRLKAGKEIKPKVKPRKTVQADKVAA